MGCSRKGQEPVTMTHIGMGISDGEIFILKATLEKFDVPEQETKDVLVFVESTREEEVEMYDMVEARLSALPDKPACFGSAGNVSYRGP